MEKNEKVIETDVNLEKLEETGNYMKKVPIVRKEKENNTNGIKDRLRNDQNWFIIQKSQKLKEKAKEWD